MYIKTILNKIKFFFEIFISSLKKADNEIMSQDDESIDPNLGTHQQAHSERVAHHLLKGEITQEVIDLRYRDYTVADESRQYKYLGDGKVIKIAQSSDNVDKFTVMNKDICASVLDSLQTENRYFHNHLITIIFEDTPRFKLDSLCEQVDVDRNTKRLCIHFSKFVNIFDQNKPFVNELKKINENPDLIKRHEFTKLNQLKFITRNVKGVKDLMYYNFIDLTLDKISETNSEYVLEYVYNSCLTEDLTKQYYSEELAERYRNKEQKKQYSGSIERDTSTSKCIICGNELRKMDGLDICQDCLYKQLVAEENKFRKMLTNK